MLTLVTSAEIELILFTLKILCLNVVSKANTKKDNIL